MYFGDAPLWNGGHESAGVTRRRRTGSSPKAPPARSSRRSSCSRIRMRRPPTSTLTFLPDSGAPVTHESTVPAHGATDHQHRAEDAVARERGGGDEGRRDAADRRRARAVLAGHARVVRSAQQLRRHGARHALGPRRRPRRRRRRLQTYILLANPNDTGAAVDDQFLREAGPPSRRTSRCAEEPLQRAGALEAPELDDERSARSVTDAPCRSWSSARCMRTPAVRSGRRGRTRRRPGCRRP